MEMCAYQDGGQMGTDILSRRLQAITQLMAFRFGSLWVVGENVWKEKLVPYGYDANSDRVEHPGICLGDRKSPEPLHAVILMLHGTSRKFCPAYWIQNFYNSEDDRDHITYFGCQFGAVPIGIDKIGRWDVKHREEKKNSVRRNRMRPELVGNEVEDLKRFVRTYLSVG